MEGKNRVKNHINRYKWTEKPLFTAFYIDSKFILYNIQEINEWVKTFKQPFNIKYSKNKITNELLNKLR